MDQEQNEEDHVSRWDNPSPVERNSQKQSPSEKAVDHNTSTDCLKSSLLNLLSNFDLSIEDLEKLSRYPDDQLTPENIPVLLQAIRKSKLTPKAPTLPSKGTEKETVPSADGSGPTIKKKVIDYGHKSKYGCNEGPMEVNASSTATDESVKGFQTQQPASVPAEASSLISNPKNLTKELIQSVGSPASTPNPQASPLVNPAKKVPLAELEIPATVPAVAPMPQAVRRPATPPLLSPAVNQPSFVTELMELLRRHGRFEHTPRADPPNRPCQTMAGQRSLWKEAEEPFKSPFGVVKASWLPDFSQTEKQKEKKLPTSPQMCDYYAVTPRIFPHTCSLCNEDCIDKTDWIQHQNTLRHNENCRRLLQQYPDWAPENPSSPKRHEGDRQERHESRQRSASPSPKRSRRSSSGHVRHWTRSRSRSSGRHRASRPRSRSPSRHSASPCPKHSRCSGSGYARHRTRSRSNSSECHRTSRSRSRSPRHPPSPRHRSRSPRHSSRWSRSSSSKESRRHESRWHFGSPSPEHSRCPGYARHRTRSRSRSSERCSRSRSRSRSPRRLPSPRHRSRSPWQSLPSSKRSQSSSSEEKRLGSSTRSTEGRYAKTPCSKKDRKWTHSSSDNREKGHKDLEWTREVTPCQKLSANKRRSQEQTCDKLVPEGQSHEWSEQSALASLTEKSVLQAMAQLQNIGAADRTLTQGTNSAQVDTSAVSSNFISMIQQVATQVITAVLDSRGASTTRASTSLGDRSTQQGTAKSTKGPSPQQGSAPGTKGPSPQQGSAPGTKGPSPQQGSAKGNKGPSPQQGNAKSTKAKLKSPGSPCPKQDTFLCSKAKNKPVVSPCVQHGTATTGMDETVHAVDQWPEPSSASGDKAANDRVMDLSPHRGIAVSGKAENQGRIAKPSGSGGLPEPCSSKEAVPSGSGTTRELFASKGGVNPSAAHNTAGFLVIAERKRVLICGHSFVFWAAHRASGTALGSQLGLSQWATIEWQGRHGLLWEGLLPLLFQRPMYMPPDVLVVHLEGNDLGLVNCKTLALQIIDDLQAIRARWPRVSIIWSAMIPRRVWRGVFSAVRINRACRSINRIIKKVLDTGLGRFLPHPRIHPQLMKLYTPDGAHLSEQGNDIFLEDIRQGLQEALGLSVGASA